MTLRCFWIEPTGQVVPVAGIMEAGPCPAGPTHHRAVTAGEPQPAVERPRPDGDGTLLDNRMPDALTAPERCDRCNHVFTDDASRFGSWQRRWVRPDTGETFDSPQAAGPGAMWNADWMPSAWKGHDARCLVAICPDGTEWMIDGGANNCTRPGEDHDCWPRHGEPPNITVDKHPEPGRSTCSAGAGSIATPGYHGFLRDGVFT